MLKEKGEKGPGAKFWIRVKIPAHMSIDTPSTKPMSPTPASSNSWWSWMSKLGCNADNGDAVVVTGTVKGHRTFNNTPETQLTRCKVAAQQEEAA